MGPLYNLICGLESYSMPRWNNIKGLEMNWNTMLMSYEQIIFMNSNEHIDFETTFGKFGFKFHYR